MFKGLTKKARMSWLLVATVLLVIGFSLGLLWQDRRIDKQALLQAQKQKQQVQKYELLARRILVENPSDVLVDFRRLQTELEEYMAERKLGTKVGLYFEYLPTGSSIGIDENSRQVGASLLKLPLTMSAYKAAEQGRLNLDTPIPLRQEWLNSQYGQLYHKGSGYKISTRDAAKEALIHSDNTAALLLFDQVTKAQNTQTPDLLGFIDANYGETPSHEVLIDSRSYAAVLKCLYFACFINLDDSQEVLEYLSRSTAKDRLVKYLSPDLKVAHKIGTFNDQTQSDCGIFYVPQRNYVLCIMVSGDDPEASEIIAEISRIVYQYITPGL